MMRFLGIAILGLLLIGCKSTINPNAKSVSMCKELRAKMVFNGSAVNPNKKFLDNADQPKIRETYHNDDCI